MSNAEQDDGEAWVACQIGSRRGYVTGEFHAVYDGESPWWVAARSKSFNWLRSTPEPPNTPRARARLDQLCRKLEAGGWVRTGTDTPDPWYALRFCRLVGVGPAVPAPPPVMHEVAMAIEPGSNGKGEPEADPANVGLSSNGDGESETVRAEEVPASGDRVTVVAQDSDDSAPAPRAEPDAARKRPPRRAQKASAPNDEAEAGPSVAAVRPAAQEEPPAPGESPGGEQPEVEAPVTAVGSSGVSGPAESPEAAEPEAENRPWWMSPRAARDVEPVFDDGGVSTRVSAYLGSG